MKTREQTIEMLAERAADQCNALAEKFRAIIDGEDNEGEEENERLCGLGLDMLDRTSFIFADPCLPRRRTVISVDAILSLSKIISSEVQVDDPKRKGGEA